MKFTINGREYDIHEVHGSFFWATDKSEGAPWPTAAHAQQDAIRHTEEEYNQPSDWVEKQTRLFCRGE